MSFLQLVLSLDKDDKGNNSIMKNLSIWPISQHTCGAQFQPKRYCIILWQCKLRYHDISPQHAAKTVVISFRTNSITSNKSMDCVLMRAIIELLYQFGLVPVFPSTLIDIGNFSLYCIHTLYQVSHSQIRRWYNKCIFVLIIKKALGNLHTWWVLQILCQLSNEARQLHTIMFQAVYIENVENTHQRKRTTKYHWKNQ